MLKVKRLACLLVFMILFCTCYMGAITPFHVLATDVVNNNSNEMALKNTILLANTVNKIQNKKMDQSQLIKEFKEKQELEKKKEDEKKKSEQKEFILTFYTSLQCENSSAGAVTCENKPLTPGGVANNVMPLNTKINLEGYGQVTVNDRGSDKYFGVDNRLDVYVAREPGESDNHYFKRVNNMGIQKVKGSIIN